MKRRITRHLVCLLSLVDIERLRLLGRKGILSLIACHDIELREVNVWVSGELIEESSGPRDGQ